VHSIMAVARGQWWVWRGKQRMVGSAEGRRHPLRALVVYETLFGNTRTVAMAVGGGLGAGADVRIVDVRDAPATVDDVDLLAVGGPTHQLGMTRSSTRRRAEVQYDEAPHAADTGLREWIASVQMPVGVATATFDTRLEHPGVLRAFGHAARATGRRLQRRGARIIPPAQRFLVVSATGPLAAGEADRAREWGQALRRTVDASKR
jgi:hypothetical protein